MLDVELVSPERILFSGQASFVRVRTVGGGEIAFLTGHAPFIGALEICAVKIITDGGAEQLVAVHGGFVEVSDDRVTILSDVAELAEDIDVGQAERARDQAQADLRNDPDDEEAQAALKRAEIRIEVATSMPARQRSSLMPRVRLASALLVPEPFAREIEGLRRALGDDIERVAPHLTLVPPVNVNLTDLRAVLAQLRAAAARVDPITVTLGPAVTFHPVNPVVYLEVGGDVDAVRAIRDGVFAGALARTLTHDFVPHVTIAENLDAGTDRRGARRARRLSRGGHVRVGPPAAGARSAVAPDRRGSLRGAAHRRPWRHRNRDLRIVASRTPRSSSSSVNNAKRPGRWSSPDATA